MNLDDNVKALIISGMNPEYAKKFACKMEAKHEILKRMETDI